MAFNSEDGALQMRDKLLALQKQHPISLEDAAIVSRREEDTVNIRQAVSLVGAGTMGGAFWGVLSCLIFWPQLARARGALGGHFSDIGVDDKFIKEVGHTIDPGNSALFLLVISATADKVLAEIESTDATVIQTSLSSEAEAKLRQHFAADEIEG
jgi:uncharacterized membrane protein